ncbi:MAG: hypothetical protein K2G15_05435 [Muribaculaceae bacterium]|nr:hypothetical protein [Muribaculaceae bacterium]
MKRFLLIFTILGTLFAYGNDLNDARRRVWNEYKASLPEILPAPMPLDSACGGSWVIPDSLEADAVMDFFFGVKGQAERYPLFIYLHGSGPRDYEWATGLKLASIFDDAPSAYFIPRIPREGEYFRWYQKGKQWAWERLLRAALASDFIDPSRIYLIGISEGGYGSQRLASFYADYLAGAGPMAGGEPLKNAPPENLANTAFSLRTGADDAGFYRNLLTSSTASALDSLAAAYSAGRYALHLVELIPGAGHSIDYRPTPLWLSQFNRNSSPRHLTWEDFEMDGRRRDSFGNLKIISRPEEAEGQRTRYDLDIHDNEISLTVNTVTYTCTERDPHWGIELKFQKEMHPARGGKVKIYLDERMVDLSRPVRLTVNGQEQFNGLLTPSESTLRDSATDFGDPTRRVPPPRTTKKR